MFKMTLKNFQSIESSSLEIDQLTVITGTNSAGKSSLVRAFVGVFLNSPSDLLVRKGSENLEVQLDFDDGSVTWLKGKHNNDYLINGDLKEKVNRGAPEGIEVLGISPVDLTGSQKKQFWPQIAQQHDPPSFVLSESGHTIAEIVVSDVDKVTHLNSALFLAEKQRREIRSREKIRQKDLEKIKKDKEKYSPLRVVSKDFKEFEKNLARMGQLLTKYEALAKAYSRYEKVREELFHLEFLLEIEVPELTSLLIRWDSLKTLLIIKKELSQREIRLEKLRDLSEWKVPVISYDMTRIKSLHEMFKVVSSNRKSFEELDTSLSTISRDLEESEKKVSSFLRQMKVCPTCGREVEDD